MGASLYGGNGSCRGVPQEPLLNAETKRKRKGHVALCGPRTVAVSNSSCRGRFGPRGPMLLPTFLATLLLAGKQWSNAVTDPEAHAPSVGWIIIARRHTGSWICTTPMNPPMAASGAASLSLPNAPVRPKVKSGSISNPGVPRAAGLLLLSQGQTWWGRGKTPPVLPQNLETRVSFAVMNSSSAGLPAWVCSIPRWIAALISPGCVTRSPYPPNARAIAA